MRWVILTALVAACGGSPAKTARAPGPSNTVVEPPPPAVSSEVEDIEPGEPDRSEMCERAMDNVVRLVGLRDQREIEQTRSAGIRDCVASNATRNDLACFLSARTLAELSRCQDFSN